MLYDSPACQQPWCTETYCRAVLNPWIVGNPSLTGLRKVCSSSTQERVFGRLK